MATLRELRTRKKAVENIEKITRAMKLVAAARLKRAQDRAQAARPYAERMQEVMQNLSRAAGEVTHPLLERREERTIAVIVVTSDRGLCGSYNTNVLRRAMELLRSRDPESVRLVLIGRKGMAFFRRHRYPIVATMPLSSTEIKFSDVQPIVTIVRELFESRQVDAVSIVYQQFVSPMTQRPTVLPLLPLRPAAGEAVGGGEEILFEPSAEELLGHLLPRYVDTQVYRTLVEAVASEHGARMTSMSAATKNAGEMIDRLTLSLNRARQAAITKEIAEIVGGAEALK